MTDQQLTTLAEQVTEQEGYYGNEAVDFKAGFECGYRKAQVEFQIKIRYLEVQNNRLIEDLADCRVDQSIIHQALENINQKGGPY